MYGKPYMPRVWWQSFGSSICKLRPYNDVLGLSCGRLERCLRAFQLRYVAR